MTITTLPTGSYGPRSYVGTAEDLTANDHVHNETGYCLKNRDGEKCADPGANA